MLCAFALVGLVTIITCTTFTAQPTTPTLLTTFTNPSPATTEFLGYSVASLGTERVIIGAYLNDTGANDAGAVHLHSLDGTLLTTFTNPMPNMHDYFGWSVAALGIDRVLIGAPDDDNTGLGDSGAAYLFNTNGLLLATFTNPTPEDYDQFGATLTAVGTDRVLIGAMNDDTGTNNAGAVYLFNTNGTLLTIFTNPTPSEGGFFGWAVAAVGMDRVVIGANRDTTGTNSVGVAYLFDISGALLVAITNPSPESGDTFGRSLAALGTDRVVIGDFQDNTGASYSGAVYLFNTNGTLLTTLTNPTPADGDHFGISVAAVGTDRVLIGANADDTVANAAGAAYLFNTNGTLLATFLNPMPNNFDEFGISVAVVGTDFVLIGAYRDDFGAVDAGAAYLFAMPGPALTISSASASEVTISWTPDTPGFALQETLSLSVTNWSNSLTGATNPVTIPATLPAKFYRLFKP